MHAANTSDRDSGVRAVLAQPGFRRLWIGQSISQVGDGLTNLAILIVINQLTHSTAALAGVAIALALPQLFFGLFAGVLVDRLDRRRIMIVSDLLRGLLVLGLIAVRSPSEVWLIFVLAFAQASVGAFFSPAKTALIPLLVKRELLLAANSLSQTSLVIMGLAGTVLAGILVALAGAWIAFSLDALSFFISALFIFAISLPPQAQRGARRPGSSVSTELVEGLQAIRSDRMVTGALITFAVGMLALGAVNVLFVPFLLNELQLGTALLGVVEAAQVIGMVLGSGLVALLAARLRVNWLIGGGVLVLGLAVASLGLAWNLLSVLALTFVTGLVQTPVLAANATLMQQRVPDEKRGRVASALNTVIVLASVISMATSGILGDALGIRKVFWGSGALVLVAGALAAYLLSERQTSPGLAAVPESAAAE